MALDPKEEVPVMDANELMALQEQANAITTATYVAGSKAVK